MNVSEVQKQFRYLPLVRETTECMALMGEKCYTVVGVQWSEDEGYIEIVLGEEGALPAHQSGGSGGIKEGSAVKYVVAQAEEPRVRSTSVRSAETKT